VDCDFGTGAERTIEHELAGLLRQVESLIDLVESTDGASSNMPAVQIGIYTGK